jgi:predicted dehydrogenase
MAKKRFRVAVIGAGMIANAGHIPAWQALNEEVEVVGVANPGEQAARDTAKRFNIQHVFTDPQKMLATLEPDIVSICSPNVSHKQWTIAALGSGAHVCCEKPIATRYQDAVEMFDTAHRVGKMLYIAQTSRFRNQNRAVREFVTAGRLGEVYFAEAAYIRRRGIPTWGKFHMKEHNAGGPLWDLGVHILDSLFWTLGNPGVKSVSGMTYTKIGNRDEGLVPSPAESGAHGGIFNPRPYDYHEFDVEDFATGYIRLENGATLMIKVSWAINLPDSSMTSIAGTEGGLQLPPLKLFTNQGGYQVEVTPRVPPDQEVAFAGHYELVLNFVRALKGEEQMIVKQEEVLNVTRTIEALYQSASEGREVQILQ